MIKLIVLIRPHQKYYVLVSLKTSAEQVPVSYSLYLVSVFNATLKLHYIFCQVTEK